MSPEHLTTLLIEYRYWILIPLTFLEGPLIAFAAGALAALDYFNVYVLAAVFFVRDVVMDVVYYYIGKYGNRSGAIHKWLEKVHIHEEHLDEVRHIWDTRPLRTMFVSKFAYGIAPAFMVIAGIVQYPLQKYIWYGTIVAVVEYGSLLALGYMFGGSIENASSVVSDILYVVTILAVVISAYYAFGMYMRHRAIRENEQANL